MKTFRIFSIAFFAILFSLISCKKSVVEESDYVNSVSQSNQLKAGRTQSPVNGNLVTAGKTLLNNLQNVAFNQKQMMFGQEFFNSYSWPNTNHEDETYSNCKGVTGEHPAVLGQDFHYYIYKTADEKRKHKEAALWAYNNGCVVTFDYHVKSKYHDGMDYQSSDQYLMYNIGEGNDAYGEVTWFNQQLQQCIDIINGDLKFPIVFRLFHEMNGNWFWWGSNSYGGSTSYKKVYQRAVNYIKARTNYVIFAWSPNYPFDTNYYPGNSYVDIMGLDMYDIGQSNSPSAQNMIDALTTLSDYAYNNNKVPVFAETGNRKNGCNADPYWWGWMTDQIYNSNRAWKVAWVLTWINVNWGGGPSSDPTYCPYESSTSTAKTQFTNFRNSSSKMWFKKEANSYGMYKAH